MPKLLSLLDNSDNITEGTTKLFISGVGTGLSFTSSEISLTGITAGNATVGALKYNGTTSAAGQFYGSTTTPTGTTRLNYAGSFYATELYEGTSRVSVSGHTHTGSAVGRTISTSDPSGGSSGDVWYKV